MRGVDKPYMLKIILHYEKKTDSVFVDAEIAGVRTLAEARKRGAEVQTGDGKLNTSKNFDEREYTAEQFKAVITSIESLKDTDL